MTLARLHPIGCLLAGLCLSPLTLAAPPEDWVPVDQAVADLDLLTISLRRVELGIRYLGDQQTKLFWDPDAGHDGRGRYFRVENMSISSFNTPLYVMRTGPKWNDVGFQVMPWRDGWFAQRIPSDIVWELDSLEKLSPPPQVQPWFNQQGRIAPLDLRVQPMTPNLPQLQPIPQAQPLGQPLKPLY